MDSLMAVELRNRLLGQFGSAFTITATAVFDYPTIGSLAEYLAAQTPELIRRKSAPSRISRREAGMSGGDRPMLEMTKVTKTYRMGGQTVRALDGITLTLTGGEFVSVVGPSGAGKSTLLHLLGALDTPDSGSIRFEGKEISDLER